jgi:hypothetical protein
VQHFSQITELNNLIKDLNGFVIIPTKKQLEPIPFHLVEGEQFFPDPLFLSKINEKA